MYDFKRGRPQKEVEKLKYMHRNPVVRGLVASPEIGGGVATDPMLTERRDWFGSTTGLGGRRQFDRALAEGREGACEKPHFSQRTREMGHPAVMLVSRFESTVIVIPVPRFCFLICVSGFGSYFTLSLVGRITQSNSP